MRRSELYAVIGDALLAALPPPRALRAKPSIDVMLNLRSDCIVVLTLALGYEDPLRRQTLARMDQIKSMRP
jgi:hypothetical protein